MTILADRRPIASGVTTHPAPAPELPELDDAQQFYLSGGYTGYTRVRSAPPAPVYYDRGSEGLAWVFREIVKELTRLMELPPRWDGRQARPIKQEAIYAFLQVLPYLLDQTSEPPQFFPLPSGGIQVEWLSGTQQVEIEIDQSGEACALATTADGDVLAEGILDTQGPSDLVSTVAGLVKNISAEIAAERQRT
jgi:hypothetical protein